MKIQVEVDIFEDPEYCCHCPITNKCFYLWHGHCTLKENNKKPDYLTIIDNFFPLISVRHDDNLYYLKSKECRAAYQKEKERPQIWYRALICDDCGELKRVQDKDTLSRIDADGGAYLCQKCELKKTK